MDFDVKFFSADFDVSRPHVAGEAARAGGCSRPPSAVWGITDTAEDLIIRTRTCFPVTVGLAVKRRALQQVSLASKPASPLYIAAMALI